MLSLKTYLIPLSMASLIIAALSGCSDDPTKPLNVDSDTYRKMVSAFYTGVTALDVGDRARAVTKLKEATGLVPNEPASWADLGLLDLLNHDLTTAATDLGRARDHAPPNSQIELLYGGLEDQNGHLPQSLDHLRKAIELNGANLRARYALTSALEREAAPGSDKVIEDQFQQILKVQPENLTAQLDLARLAAKSGDTTLVRSTAGTLAPQTSSWPAEARDQFNQLRSAIKSNNSALVTTRITILKNVLLSTATYQHSLASLTFPKGQIAEPVENFLRLPLPRSTPAPPDSKLHFTSKAAGTSRAEWASALVLAPSFAPEPGVAAGPEPPPAIIWKAGSELHVGTATVPFPAGKASGQPSQQGSDGVPLRTALLQNIGLETPWSTCCLRHRHPFSDRLQSPAGTPRRVRMAESHLKQDGLLSGLPTMVSHNYSVGTGGTSTPSAPESVCPIDWNNDNKPDLALAGAGGLRLFQQSNPTTWKDVTTAAHLPAVITGGAYTGAWAADIDLDGDLDLVLGSAIGSPVALQNNGDGTWAVIHPFPGVSGLRAFVWADMDGDGVPDAALIDGAGRLAVFSNARSGRYRRLPDPTSLGKVAAISVADLDGDGALSLVVLQAGGSIRRLTWESKGNGWQSSEIARWPQAPADGSARLFWADLDNNGAPDLIASGSRGSQVWLTDDQRHLVPLASPIPSRVTTAADFNGDGRLDLAGIGADGHPVQLINSGEKNYHWQVIRPRGDPNVQPDKTNEEVSTGNQKINSFGVGGAIELRSGLLAQRAPISSSEVHFGLADYTTADAARITWPNGQAQGEFDLKGDGAVAAKQRLDGSCPWLFAWDGKAMKFVTDILWKSPLGLRINAQATAGVSQTRDWVKMRSDQLQPHNGFYDLSITAELWETDFFDMVRLMTVDHPVGTEVFVDERFAIPQPPLQLNLTGPVRPVARAVDDRGQDVTALVRARDGRYLNTFGLGKYQGLTRDHWVELELPPDTGRAGKTWLVCNGWIYPTDSSINVALSQGHGPHPEGLSLEVPNAAGHWNTIRKGLGFPAGKNKTILIDLSGVFPKAFSGPRRVRLRTNLEIYWDSIGVADALPPAQIRTCLAAPHVADLHYRGFSAVHQANRTSPELPDYNDLAQIGQPWLDLEGCYTRFGDVLPLLKEVDDRYVIMNAGDEIRLQFPVSAPPPAGWVRDFVFISDGWDKDGNYNTSFSKTVLPLPLHDHPAYNTPPGPLEDDPAYRRHPEDWETYQTRPVSVYDFVRGLRPRDPS